MLKDYVKIARPDHWIKQLFILPGIVFALFLTGEDRLSGTALAISLIFAFISTCFTASSNYVINEWLDADFDRFHPTKKNRPVVADNLSVKWILFEYAVLAVIGLVTGWISGRLVFYMEAFLWLMGIFYNVKPFRTKEIPYLDVISESVNNAIRLLIGWFAVTTACYPPVSVVIGYWMGGAFLMAVKRYAEYRMIGDKELAGSYRKSFRYYTEESLLISSFFYALMSVFFCGVFMIKYKIELVFAIPMFCGLFCYYLKISYKQDSSVQKPEKLYREKGLMAYILVFIILLAVLMLSEISGLSIFIGNELVRIK